jgi:hypothetical protein
MKIPNAERAEVDIRKLVDYCLSPTHKLGRHKAVVFEAALGLTIIDAFKLGAWLLQAAVETDAIMGRSDKFGDRYQIDFEVVTASGHAMVRSAWIIRSDEDFPRLTTCFVLPN